MQTEFTTLSTSSESFLKERNSKFYAFAMPVNSKADIKKELNDLQELYPDASHHCYAYILGIDKIEERANDDGEPSSSAGKPILRQLLSKGVTNSLVVVVRYFGGKKLGVPGLIYAYGESAKLALESNRIITREVLIQFRVKSDYGAENNIYRIAKKYGAKIETVASMERFECKLTIGLASKGLIEEAFIDLHKIELEIEDNASK
jgi:uncharacterized YigZ family protein